MKLYIFKVKCRFIVDVKFCQTQIRSVKVQIEGMFSYFFARVASLINNRDKEIR